MSIGLILLIILVIFLLGGFSGFRGGPGYGFGHGLNGGLGLLIASRAKTVEGVSGLMNFVMLPMWIFSGVFFSSSNFPGVVQPIIKALPLTAVNNALRANMLEGTHLTGLGLEMTVIVAWMVISFVAALKLFRWR